MTSRGLKKSLSAFPAKTYSHCNDNLNKNFNTIGGVQQDIVPDFVQKVKEKKRTEE